MHLRRLEVICVALIVGAAGGCSTSNESDAAGPPDSGADASGGASGHAGDAGIRDAEGGVPNGTTGEGGVSACPDAPPTRGLEVRFRASVGVLLEDGRVARWADEASDDNAAHQADGAHRPELIADAINGQPALRFDGSNDFLTFGFPVTGRDAITIAAVSRTWEYQLGGYNADCDFLNGEKDGLSDIGRELNCSGTDQGLLVWNEGGGGFESTGIFFGVGQTEATFRFGTGHDYRFFKTPFVLEHPPGDAFVASMAVVDGHERVFYLNGEVPRGTLNYRDPETYALATSARVDEAGVEHVNWPAAIGDTEPNAWIGRGRFEEATSFWAGEVAEILVYTVALSPEERRVFAAYATCRYLSGDTVSLRE